MEIKLEKAKESDAESIFDIQVKAFMSSLKLFSNDDIKAFT